MSESTTTPETTTATLRGIDHTLPAREQRLAARRMIAAAFHHFGETVTVRGERVRRPRAFELRAVRAP